MILADGRRALLRLGWHRLPTAIAATSREVAACCNMLQHLAATSCGNTRQQVATSCCNMLQHAATCMALQPPSSSGSARMRRFIVAAEKVHAGMDPAKLITIHPNFRTIVLANRPGPMAIASPVSQCDQFRMALPTQQRQRRPSPVPLGRRWSGLGGGAPCGPRPPPPPPRRSAVPTSRRSDVS